jgi:hypothetical protein
MRPVLALLAVVMVAGCSGAVATGQPPLGADGCPTAWPARHEQGRYALSPLSTVR